MKTAKERYMSDPNFKSLVDMMEAFIHKNEFTPSEMREASILASINYEMKVVRDLDGRIYFTPELEEALQTIRNEVIKSEDASR